MHGVYLTMPVASNVGPGISIWADMLTGTSLWGGYRRYNTDSSGRLGARENIFNSLSKKIVQTWSKYIISARGDSYINVLIVGKESIVQIQFMGGGGAY